MAEDVLDYLRHQFARMDERFDRLERYQREMLARFARLDTGHARLRQDQGSDAETVAHVQVQIDQVNDRIDRIERRLGLIEEPTP
jgi:ubiquinone biosynthesis protein UbiJ